MEVVIAKLLQAFEKGQMSRRQLVQSLAIAATGAHALSSAAPLAAATTDAASAGGAAAPAASPFHTASLDHISYAVSDYGRSRDFYMDLMGWTMVEDDGKQQARLRIGDVGDIIVRKNRRPMPAQPSADGRPPLTGVVNHIAWRLTEFDTDAVREELERRGLKPRRDQGTPGMDYDSYHILDPDGWDLQISR